VFKSTLNSGVCPTPIASIFSIRESRDSFAILARENIIAPDLGDRLKRMVGFRNLAVHQYRELNLDILDAVIRNNLDDLLSFARAVRLDL
jgi:uncharacterized protein YutE (UPF0331/DUF86 family)